MAPAAKSTGSGYVSGRVYFAEHEWNDLRHEGIDENVSASAILVALWRLYQADAELRARALADAQAINAERRKRSD